MANAQISIAVAEQRIKANEARLHRLEESHAALRSHFDKGIGIVGFLVVIMPIAVQLLMG